MELVREWFGVKHVAWLARTRTGTKRGAETVTMQPLSRVPSLTLPCLTFLNNPCPSRQVMLAASVHLARRQSVQCDVSWAPPSQHPVPCVLLPFSILLFPRPCYLGPVEGWVEHSFGEERREVEMVRELSEDETAGDTSDDRAYDEREDSGIFLRDRPNQM